ncbi:hypothetical protein M8494_25590 [Serratia ureilytica]
MARSGWRFRSGVLVQRAGRRRLHRQRGDGQDVQIHFPPLLDSWDDAPGEPLPVFTASRSRSVTCSRRRAAKCCCSSNPHDPVKLHASYLRPPRRFGRQRAR